MHPHSSNAEYGLPTISEVDVLRERERTISIRLESLLADPATAQTPEAGVCAAALRETRAELSRAIHGD